MKFLHTCAVRIQFTEKDDLSALRTYLVISRAFIGCRGWGMLSCLYLRLSLYAKHELHGTESSLRKLRSHRQTNSQPLYIPKIHYRVYKSPLLVSVLSQMNAVRVVTFYFFNIQFTVIPPFTSTSHKWHFPSRLSIKNFQRVSHHLQGATWPSCLILLDLITLIIFVEVYRL